MSDIKGNPKSPAKRWKSDQIESVLKLYRDHYELLWNRKHKDYENPRERKFLLDKLRRDLCEMEIYAPNTAFINQKLKAIRETYRQELKKTHAAKICLENCDEEHEPYEPKLKWFQTADSFLRDHINLNLSKTLTPVKMEDAGIEVFTEHDFIVEGPDVQVMDFQNNVDETGNICEIQDITIQPKKIKTPKRRLLKKHQAKAKVQETSFELLNQTGSMHQSQSFIEEDEYETFSKHIVSQLRKLPLQNFIVLQEKIQSLITHERLTVIRETQERLQTITNPAVSPDH